MALISSLNYRKKSTVSKAKKGHKEAFLALIDEKRLNLYRVARGILKDKEDYEILKHRQKKCYCRCFIIIYDCVCFKSM